MPRKAMKIDSEFKVITINVNKEALELINNIVDLGGAPSRSELMKYIIRDWLKSEMKFTGNVKDLLTELRIMLKTENLKKKELIDMITKPITKPTNQELVKVKRLINDEFVNGVHLREFENILIPKELAKKLKQERIETRQQY